MGEKNNLSYNVIIAIDHIYEDDIKLQTVIIQKKAVRAMQKSVLRVTTSLLQRTHIAVGKYSAHKLLWNKT